MNSPISISNGQIPGRYPPPGSGSRAGIGCLSQCWLPAWTVGGWSGVAAREYPVMTTSGSGIGIVRASPHILSHFLRTKIFPILIPLKFFYLRFWVKFYSMVFSTIIWVRGFK